MTRSLEDLLVRWKLVWTLSSMSRSDGLPARRPEVGRDARIRRAGSPSLRGNGATQYLIAHDPTTPFFAEGNQVLVVGIVVDVASFL